MNEEYIDPIKIQRIRVAVDAVAIAVESSEKYILLIKRQYEPFKEHWALPGGFVHTNEELENAAVREFYEETGIKVEEDRITQIGIFSKLGRDPRPQRVISIAYKIDLDKRYDIKLNNEVLDAKWISVNDLPDIKLAFDHKDIIDRALSNG